MTSTIPIAETAATRAAFRKSKVRGIKVADLFCGAGGTSTGLKNACDEAGLELELLAINHWDVAIATHSSNHPKARHLCENMDNVDPHKAVPGGRLNLLIASPECTHHSNARGGRPMNDQSRASAWHIVRWAEALYIDSILVENVREFESWGPLGANGRPLKSKRGQTFQAFLTALRSLGYTVDYRILCAADYGDPTTRERLFIQARRGNKKITWPEPTHTANTQPSLFADDKRRPWRAAREIIDWSIKGKPISERKRPLAPATMERIMAGLRKFGGSQAEPFLVVLRNNAGARSAAEPLPTVTAGGGHFGVCEPFILQQQSGGAPRSVKDPLPTVATDGAIALVEPFLVSACHGDEGPGSRDRRCHSLADPVPTVVGSNAFALVEPFLVTTGGPEGSGRTARSVSEPMKTVLTCDHTALIEPFIVPMNRKNEGPRSVEDPLRTVTATSADFGLAEPFIVSMEHGGKRLCEPFVAPVNHGNDHRTYPVDRPMPTVTTVDAWGLVEPFLVKYYGTSGAASVDEPLDTVTARSRFGLVEIDGMVLDIRFRMLQPHELARAQGFPADYKFTGNREEKVKQIGNAVCVNLATALCKELIS